MQGEDGRYKDKGWAAQVDADQRHVRKKGKTEKEIQSIQSEIQTAVVTGCKPCPPSLFSGRHPNESHPLESQPHDNGSQQRKISNSSRSIEIIPLRRSVYFVGPPGQRTCMHACPSTPSPPSSSNIIQTTTRNTASDISNHQMNERCLMIRQGTVGGVGIPQGREEEGCVGSTIRWARQSRRGKEDPFLQNPLDRLFCRLSPPPALTNNQKIKPILTKLALSLYHTPMHERHLPALKATGKTKA